MRRRAVILTMGILAACAARAADPGRDVVGELTVTVYFGTDGDPSQAGPRAAEVEAGVRRGLEAQEPLKFGHYRRLGADSKPIFRSYENWAQPIAGSEEILCRFEVQSRPTNSSMRMDLELWLSHRKVLKTGAMVAEGKPVWVLGPEWRDGRLIVAVELTPAAKPGS